MSCSYISQNLGTVGRNIQDRGAMLPESQDDGCMTGLDNSVSFKYLHLKTISSNTLKMLNINHKLDLTRIRMDLSKYISLPLLLEEPIYVLLLVDQECHPLHTVVQTMEWNFC